MPYLHGDAFVPIEKLRDEEVRRHVEGYAGDPLRHLIALAKLGALDQWVNKGQRSS
jgi:hypothetical protein